MSKKIIVELTELQAQQITDHIKVRHHGAAECDTARYLYKAIQKQKEPKWEVEDCKMGMHYVGGIGSPLHVRIYETAKGDHDKTLVVIDKWPLHHTATYCAIGVFGGVTFYQGTHAGTIYEHVVYLPMKGSPPLIQLFDRLLANHFMAAFREFRDHLLTEEKNV